MRSFIQCKEGAEAALLYHQSDHDRCRLDRGTIVASSERIRGEYPNFESFELKTVIRV